MRQAYKFLTLPIPDRYLLIEAALLVAVVRLGLWVLPFRMLRRLLDRLVRRSRIREDRRRHANEASLFALLRVPSRIEIRASPERIAWAVAAASSYVPAATCLVQAMAAEVLLGRRGYPSSLRIGVAKSAGGQLEAHAWVECRGRVVIGERQALSRYSPLPVSEIGRL